MNHTQPVVDNIIQQITTNSRIKALLDAQPFLGRINYVPEVKGIIEKLPYDLAAKLQNIISEDKARQIDTGNDFYDYYAILEITLERQQIVIQSGYDPYMAETIWYVADEPEKALQALKAPFYPLRVEEKEVKKIETVAAEFFAGLKIAEPVDFILHLVNRPTNILFGQLVQTGRNTNKFVFLPENDYVHIQNV